MPRLQFRTLSAGPGGIRHAGSIHDVPESEAADLQRHGYAFRVDSQGNPVSAPPAPPASTLPPTRRNQVPAETAARKPDGTSK